MINKETANRVPIFVPFQEPVTYFYRTGGDTFTTYDVAKARRKKVNQRDGDFAPEILATADLIWQTTSQYLTVTPRTDDHLVDQYGVTWVVTGVVLQFNGCVYNMACRKGVG